jgi:hypothetical protein
MATNTHTDEKKYIPLPSRRDLIVDPPEVTQIVRAFEAASFSGVSVPKLRFGKYLFRLGSQLSQFKNQIIFVRGNAYLGRITPLDKPPVFYPGKDMTLQDVVVFSEIVRDLKAALVREGKASGICSICGRGLSDPKSIELGIGPVCLTNFGL